MAIRKSGIYVMLLENAGQTNVTLRRMQDRECRTTENAGQTNVTLKLLVKPGVKPG
jgi:hypothetical protein